MTAPRIRAYEPKDRETIRRIACETALYGNPIDPLINDRDLVADYLVRYYTDFEPESLFVAEVEGKVVGYLTGCLNSEKCRQIVQRRILPPLLVRFFIHGHWFQGKILRMLLAIWRSERRWVSARWAACAPYPAHCHLNLDPEFRRAGTGSGLLEAFLAQLRQHRVPGIHIITATEQGKNFFVRAGFTLLMQYDSASLPGASARETWVMGKKLEAA